MCSRGSSRVPRSTSNLAKTACLPLKTQALGATHLKLGNKAIMPEVALKVGMTCQGCVGAVNRVLNKLEGVEKVDIDLASKKVTVRGNVTPEAVKDKVAKTGLPTEFWA